MCAYQTAQVASACSKVIKPCVLPDRADRALGFPVQLYEVVAPVRAAQPQSVWATLPARPDSLSLCAAAADSAASAAAGRSTIQLGNGTRAARL